MLDEASLMDNLMSKAPFGVAIVDAEFKLYKLNAMLAQIMRGSSVDETLSQPVFKIIGQKRWKEVKPFFQRALAGESIINVPITGSRSNFLNTLRSYLVSFYPLNLSEQKTYVGIIVQEVTQQKHVEEEIEQYRNKLEMAQEASGIGLFDWNIVEDKLWLSPEEINVLCLQGKTLTGTLKDWASVSHPEDLIKITELIKTLSEQHLPFEAELRIFDQDGNIKWIKGKGKFFYNAEGKMTHLVGGSYDISKRKKEEESLHFKAAISRILISSLSFNQTIAETCSLATTYISDWCVIEMINESGQLENLKIVHKNPAKVSLARKFQKKFPTSLESNEGTARVLRSGEPLFIPLLTDKMLDKLSQDKEKVKFAKELGLKSIIIVPITIQQKVRGTITLAIAESRKRYDSDDLEMAKQLASRTSLCLENAVLYSQIRKERKRLQDLLANVPSVVWEVISSAEDSTQGMTFISSYIKELLGYPMSKWTSVPEFWYTVIHPDDRDRVAEHSKLLYQTGQSGVIRFRWITKDKKVIWAETHSTPILDHSGKVVGLRGVTMDISEQMKIEQRKDDFLAMASHELKTPLTSLKLLTQVLAQTSSITTESTSKKYVQQLEKQIDRLTTTVYDLLDLTRIQTGKFQLEMTTFSLQSLLEEIISSLQQSMKHHIILEHASNSLISADRNRLEQVFINLITNAVKYSPQADKVILRLEKKYGQLIVSVTDFGIGISTEHHTQIFQRFYRAFDEKDKTFPGLGMGLFIAKSIIDQHQGMMWVESKPGSGSTFYVSLPIHTKDEKG